MATDYNANLIAELYTTDNQKLATRITSEMVDIGDDIFPRQIYEAYKKFRNSSVSHCFVSDLTKFKTNDSIEILKEIALKSERHGDITMMLGALTDIGYFEPSVVNKIRKMFTDDIVKHDLYGYDIERYFTYLEKSGEKIEFLEFSLKTCFEDDEQDVDARKIALKKLLKLKPKEFIEEYYNSYETIIGTKVEIIFVEEISNWKGGIVPKLYEKILKLGSSRAREILENKQSIKDAEIKEQDKKEQKEVREEYETSDVISEISEFRSKINMICTTDERFGFPLLLKSEEIYQQGKSAKDKATLVGYCIVLRSLLGGFSEEVMGLEFTKERANELLPEIKEINASINKFHLVLLDKQIVVDKDIFGLRNISRTVAKFAHPDEGEEPKLIKILKQEGLFEYYKNDNWSALHREILLRYKTFLEILLKAITKKPEITTD